MDIGPHRRFDWVRADLSDIKAIKNKLGGTVNDVVLAVVTGALRGFMQQRGEPVDGVTLKAMVPVSVRRENEYGMTGNRVAAMMASLPIYEVDPVERLRILSDELSGLKESGQAVGAEALTAAGRVRPADGAGPGQPPAIAAALLQSGRSPTCPARRWSCTCSAARSWTCSRSHRWRAARPCASRS